MAGSCLADVKSPNKATFLSLNCIVVETLYMAYSIKELESLSGIKAHTIRIWEQRYHFLRPSRTETNIRTYNNEELKTLLTVALLNKYGYKISRIDEMGAEQRNHAVMQLQQEEARQESLVNTLVGFMIDLKSADFEWELNQYIESKGIESLITEVMFHFLEKVGILWQTNRIIPVQEHIVSSIIRQKLVAAIDALPLVRHSHANFLLFLPEDEHHELGLLYVYYLLRRKGVAVIYLGANVPLKDIQFLMTVRKPNYFYIHLTSSPRQHSFQKFLATVTNAAPDARILISGSGIPPAKQVPSQNVIFLNSLLEVQRFMEEVK